jgi:hypothetical protein
MAAPCGDKKTDAGKRKGLGNFSQREFPTSSIYSILARWPRWQAEVPLRRRSKRHGAYFELLWYSRWPFLNNSRA